MLDDFARVARLDTHDVGSILAAFPEHCRAAAALRAKPAPAARRRRKRMRTRRHRSATGTAWRETSATPIARTYGRASNASPPRSKSSHTPNEEVFR